MKKKLSAIGTTGQGDFPVRASVHENAKHAEIAQDARRALTVDGHEPVFDAGEIYTCTKNIWHILPKSSLHSWIGMAYRHCNAASKNSDYRAIRSTIEDILARPGFFNDTKPGVAAVGRFWRVTEAGKLYNEPLTAEHGQRFELPFAPDTSEGEPEMLGDLFSMVFDAEAREGLAVAVGALMGASILGLAGYFKEAGFLIGSGDTGKSTIGALLTKLLPPGVCSALPLSALSDKHSIGNLEGKRVNIPGEEAADIVFDAARFKQITGGDPVSARFVHGREFSFVSNALNIFTANKMPPLREHGKQIYNRMVFIRFSRPVPNEKRIGKTEVAAQKMFDSEGAKILGWAMHCAASAMVNGTMKNEATEMATADWRQVDDTVLSAFFDPDGCFEITGNEKHTLTGVGAYEIYSDHTLSTGRKPKSRTEFYGRLENSPDFKKVGISLGWNRTKSRQIAGARRKLDVQIERLALLSSAVSIISEDD